MATVVRRAIDEMKTHGATAIDVDGAELAALLAASNLLIAGAEVLPRRLLEDVRRGRSSRWRSLLARGSTPRSLQGILEVANAITRRLPRERRLQGQARRARRRSGRRSSAVMDANRLDAIVYPTSAGSRRVVGGKQVGSNAGLSAQTGFPAISVPAGFTPGGFPVGVETARASVHRADAAGARVRLRAGHTSSTSASAGRPNPGVAFARWRARRGASGRHRDGRPLVTAVEGGFSSGGAIYVYRSIHAN